MKQKKNNGGLISTPPNRQQSKLLMKAGADIDEMMFGGFQQKMRQGGSAKRMAYKAETGKESMQEYKIGGWTSSKKKK
tara:strand:- start:658 stop:891 length:234 start_codon:yes stop_codon:yes gene_type:complete